MSPTHPPPLPFLLDVLQIALLHYFVFTPIIFTARLLLVQKLSGLDMYCGFGWSQSGMLDGCEMSGTGPAGVSHVWCIS